jgi:hypothetical protein
MRRAAVCVAFVCLAACGGGGSGGNGGGAGPQTTGLVPVASALGATLHADASVLRVLRPGSVWTYRGVDLPDASGNQSTVYENLVTHAAAAVGVNEAGSNYFNAGTDVTPVRVEAGTVLQRIDLTALGADGPFDAIELRSPVRVSDQYTIFDRRIPDALADIDGDNKPETLDVAMWSRVIGEETVELLQRPGLRAVRVETTLLARARLSRNADFTETVRSTNNVWYSAGVGIVKLVADTPNANVPSLRQVTTETLFSWDGLTEGLGASAIVAGVGPSGSALEGEALGAPIDSASFGSHAVLRVSRGAVVNLTLARVDSSGRVTQAAAYPPETLDGQVIFPRQMFGAGNGLRVVSWSSQGLVLTSYDSNSLQRVAGAPVVLAGVPGAATGDGFDVVVGASGNRIWMMWPRSTGTFVDGLPAADLMVRVFDASGAPIGPEITLRAEINSTSLSSMAIAVNAGQAIASWVEGNNSSLQYRVFDNDSGVVLASRDLPADAVYARGWATSSRLGFVQAIGANQGAAWLLDNSFAAVSGLGGPLSGEVIAPLPWRPFSLAGSLAASGDDLYFAGTTIGRTWPEDVLDSTTIVLFAVTPSSGPLSTTGMVKPLVRVPIGSNDFLPSFAIPLTDKVLLIGTTTGQQLGVRSVWR